MENIDWTHFELRIRINKPLDTVFKAWVVPAELVNWFLESADYYQGESKWDKDTPIQEQLTYKWKWHNWESVHEGSVLNMNGRDQLSFEFGHGMEVHVNLISTTPNSTEIVLRQEQIPVDEKSKLNFYVGCSNGWGFWLVNLKAWLEHGVTLNAKGLKQSQTKNLVNS